MSRFRHPNADFLRSSAFFVGLTFLIALLCVPVGLHVGASLAENDRTAAQTAADLGALVGAVVAGFSLVVGYLLFRQGAAIARLNSRADIIIDCTERYDRITSAEALSVSRRDIVMARHLYGELMALKSDQVDFYLAGWVDADTLFGWLHSTLGHLRAARGRKPRLLYGFSFEWGWNEVRHQHATRNPIFHEVMEALLLISEGDRALQDNLVPQSAIDLHAAAAMRELMRELDEFTASARRMIARDYRAYNYFDVLEEIRDAILIRPALIHLMRFGDHEEGWRFVERLKAEHRRVLKARRRERFQVRRHRFYRELDARWPQLAPTRRLGLAARQATALGFASMVVSDSAIVWSQLPI